MNQSIVYRALVTYSNTDTGEIRVKIPSLIGVSDEVSISYIGRSPSNDYWAVPKIGDQIVVTSDDINLTNVFWVQTEPYNPGTKEPTGFSNAKDSIISFDNLTRTFTISPIDAYYEVFVRGIKYQINEPQSITIPNTNGGYSIYFDATGNLGYRLGHFDFEWEAPVTYIYWSSTRAILFADERHGTTMDWQTHEYLHRTQGSQYASGFAISNYTTAGTGSNVADLKFDIANGTFFDEDYQIDITHSGTPVTNTWQQKLQGGAYVPVFYKTPLGWEKTTATQYPVKFNTTYPQYNNGTSLVEMNQNRYSNSWIVATNNLNEPVICIMGQAEHSNIAGAEAESWANLSLTSFPVQEFRPLWKITFQAVNGSAIKAAIRAVTDLRTTIKSVATTTEAISGWSTSQFIRSITTSTDSPTSSDNGKLLNIDTSSGTVTITINDVLAPGQRIDFIWLGSATSVTFVKGTAGTLNGTPGLKLRAQYSASTILCTSVGNYALIGDLSA